MTSNSNTNNHCAVCSKVIFTFERKISVSDMRAEEQKAYHYQSLTGPTANDVPNLQVSKGAVVCVTCFRKMQGRCDTKSAEAERVKRDKNAGDSEFHKEKQNAEDSSLEKGVTRRKPHSDKSPPHETPDQNSTADRGGEKLCPGTREADLTSSKSPETSESDAEEDGDATLRFTVFTLSAATLGALAAVVAAPAAIAAIGFGAGGVVTGSAASSIMSTGLGVVLQNIGMAGFGMAGTAAVGTAGGVVGAGIGGLVAKLTANKVDKNDESPLGEIKAEAGGGAGGSEVTKGSDDGEYEPPGGKISCNLGRKDKTGGSGRCNGKSDASLVEEKSQSCESNQDSILQDSNVFHASATDADQDAGMSAFQQEITVAAASAVSSGVSLAGTSTHTLMQDGYWVTCGIEVENWTRFPLICPHVQLKAGVLSVAPSVIVPASREVMVARKSSGTATGSCGTVSWLIQDANRRLVIMWSAPFNFNHHSNWLAVGLSAAGVTDHAANDVWFDQMYYDCKADDVKFKLREYYSDVRPVFFRDADFEVEGIMASDHKALVKVIFRTLNKDHLAPNIKEKMLMK